FVSQFFTPNLTDVRAPDYGTQKHKRDNLGASVLPLSSSYNLNLALRRAFPPPCLNEAGEDSINDSILELLYFIAHLLTTCTETSTMPIPDWSPVFLALGSAQPKFMLIQGCSTPNSGNSNIPNGSLSPDNGSSKLKVMLNQGCSTPNSGGSNIPNGSLSPDNGSSKLKVMLIHGCLTPNSGNSNIPNGSLSPDNGSSKLKVMLIQGCSNLEQWQLDLRVNNDRCDFTYKYFLGLVSKNNRPRHSLSNSITVCPNSVTVFESITNLSFATGWYSRTYLLLQIKLASDKISESGKPRGYAFIEYEHERDMHYCSN
ncbi:hypothetical protein MAR_008681, partial [Mya arenaria]